MDKRSATLSCRVTPEMALAAGRLAELDGASVSDLLCRLLEREIAERQRAYLQLSRVFGQGNDLPGKHDE
jgi:hypothetical protein